MIKKLKTLLAWRNLKKAKDHVLHESSIAYHMREDIGDPDQLEALRKAREETKEAWKSRDPKKLETMLGVVQELSKKVYPPGPYPAVKENIEIIVVALAVVMGFRAYFFQPYGIPTGSMQPTLWGITHHKQEEKRWQDRFPFKPVNWLITGEWYMEYKAKASGYLTLADANMPMDMRGMYFVFRIGNTVQKVPRDALFEEELELGMMVHEGDVLARALRKSGDHIFVNRMSYNFSRPERGDISVFTTKGILDEGQFYIKRLVGMPGERFEIRDERVWSNGHPVDTPEHFQNWAYWAPPQKDDRAKYINDGSPEHKMSKQGYFLMGDNTRSSYDSRYWGEVPQEKMMGPAFMVYWPFSRFGWAK